MYFPQTAELLRCCNHWLQWDSAVGTLWFANAMDRSFSSVIRACCLLSLRGLHQKGNVFAHRNGDILEMEVVTIELHVAPGQAETAWPAVDVWTLLLRYSCIPKKCFTLRRRAAPSLDKIWHFTASALTHTKMITCHRVLGMLKRERKNKKQHRKGKRASKGCTVHYRG